MASADELDRREREILRALVQDYIHTGEPVASQPLLSRHELEWSPATVRSVMADLEALGFLEKPHASSGRIPTERGYRLFVDTMLKVRPPSVADRDRIERLAQAAPDVSSLIEGTADLLHSLSHHAGVVTTPRPQADPVRQLEFVRLRENRVLVVFVSEAGIVTNKLVQLEFAMEPAELERAAAYLNEKLHARADAAELAALRAAILTDMRADQSALHDLLQKALVLAEQSFAGTGVEKVVMEGESSFLDAPEFSDVQKARALLRGFAEKDRILRVLDRVLTAQEVQIFIGAESEFATVPDVSVVAAPYGRGDRVLGTLAVVGPTRMNYARVIPLVDLTARQISRALAALSEGG
ncbi:heat-inducible transcription repressor HrcA [Anaeromyxobacter sp. K]|uniref:Heat-inducible transcription repressor HrcA n=2 Tax=Anaeromyxobacter TaxID=161492 RepID=HRCA_ANAD2|nr:MULTISPECIES: heat-inducible transcriptional repressor HrcA [Anaeromyxobacter]B4UJT7.1 RecName: Full=Heat-inducible transcription repressor HrcA [Anaeromyxobacter sp. K]B8JCT2.1 RecName: Full=Heat-inducible transcription repressor HrcA [Anaeromyxobacter dehalogenans 2CP-1]ACG75668.1 heat-inducible transcription repressor HrcA [Anaeromyxobacter sp. K]ACL67802.1 heat-inducible transcription repressor HrcA [Anaeromyxobacter dehalogenans 2CP-1]